MEKAKRGTRDWALQIAARVWQDQEFETVTMDEEAAKEIAWIILRVQQRQEDGGLKRPVSGSLAGG